MKRIEELEKLEKEAEKLRKRYYLQDLRVLYKELEEVVKGLLIKPPRRPKPDFIEVPWDIDEKVVGYTTKQIGKMQFTQAGNPANPVEFERLTMVRGLAFDLKHYEGLEKLRERYHPEFPYKARKSTSPHVEKVGRETIKFRLAPWFCNVRGIKLDTPEPYRDDLVEVASRGYIVWKDGFGIKGEKAIEWGNKPPMYNFIYEVIHPSVFNTLKRCIRENIKIFNYPIGGRHDR